MSHEPVPPFASDIGLAAMDSQALTLSVGVFRAFPAFGLLYLTIAMPSSVSIATCCSFGGVDVDIAAVRNLGNAVPKNELRAIVCDTGLPLSKSLGSILLSGGVNL